MSRPATPSVAAIVVAAGKGLRAGQPLPKQFATWRGKPLLRYSVEALVQAGVAPVIVVIPDGAHDVAGKALSGLPVGSSSAGSTASSRCATGSRRWRKTHPPAC